jgi:uncharacterized membrane protein
MRQSMSTLPQHTGPAHRAAPPRGPGVSRSEPGIPAGMNQPRDPAPVVSVFGPALLLGIGLGGFVDGIVLHQLLRWHHLLSSRPGSGLTANLVADGLFHAGTWLAVVIGLVWLWRRARRGPRSWPWPALIGPLLAGWGLFNLVEGLVDHHLLGLHHVRPGPHQLWYDLGFLALGAVLLLLGMAIRRPVTRRPVTRRGAPAGPR